tara:strand:+ start:866 stop:1291 length:426 start_codon:yes stop_codon:yes gene_type:complete
MNSRNKGALAEYRFLSYAISLDLKVLMPAVEGYAYDLVVDNGKRFFKIQVKYAGRDKRHPNTFRVMAHRRITNGKNLKSNELYRNYHATEVDFFAVYIWNIDTFYIIPHKEVLRSSITLNLRSKNNNNKYEAFRNNWKQLL